MKAKVFLSCGQNKHSEEPVIAERIAQSIRDLGFECYMAVAEQTLLGLRENIFTQLETADYFVFIDFQREKLESKNGVAFHRGSLFSHQELGIASYLQIPGLVLQEDGVKPLDGMLGVMQANAMPFSDRRHLPAIVSEAIRKRIEQNDWCTTTRNILTLHLPERPFSDATRPEGITGRYFHIATRNNHGRKSALNCFAYLERADNLRTNQPVPLETIEFKWAGTVLPNVRIAPQAARRFDALWFVHANPIQLAFNVFADSTEYYPKLQGPGSYRLTFAVVSGNFAVARKPFLLEYGNSLDSIKFQEMSA
jgi:hypothetical protein